jgi:hypothetical protein
MVRGGGVGIALPCGLSIGPCLDPSSPQKVERCHLVTEVVFSASSDAPQSFRIICPLFLPARSGRLREREGLIGALALP